MEERRGGHKAPYSVRLTCLDALELSEKQELWYIVYVAMCTKDERNGGEEVLLV